VVGRRQAWVTAALACTVYAGAAAAGERGDFDLARRLLREAEAAGIEEASQWLADLAPAMGQDLGHTGDEDAPADRPVTDSLGLLAPLRRRGRQGPLLRPRRASAPRRVVSKAWREAVVDAAGRIERIPCELCVPVALRDAVRRREVYVAGANRWRNPEDDLPGDFETAREVYYAALRQPTDPGCSSSTCGSG
jgi:hypothetical protein